MTEKTGVNLVTYQLTPLQVAFIEWCKAHPYARIREIKIHEAVPLEAEVISADGLGTETVRFDKIAKVAGLI